MPLTAPLTTPATTPSEGTAGGLDLTPWTGEMDWYDSCRPNYDTFLEGVTDAQHALLASHGLTFTEDDDDYTVRQVLLPKLHAIDADEHPAVTDLIDLVEEALCPVECNYCAENEKDWLIEQLDDAVRHFTGAHPDVKWVVTDWRGDSLSVDEEPNVKTMLDRYFKTFRDYSKISVGLHTPEAFATVAFDRVTFTVHAFTDELDRDLIGHALDKSGYDGNVDVSPLLDASPELRALMWQLTLDHGDLALPGELLITQHGDRPSVEKVRLFGILEDAELPELAAIAAPLLGLTEEARGYALLLLSDSGPDWATTVAAAAAAAA